jgi:uncharacterized OB-fold protein
MIYNERHPFFDKSTNEKSSSRLRYGEMKRTIIAKRDSDGSLLFPPFKKNPKDNGYTPPVILR